MTPYGQYPGQGYGPPPPQKESKAILALVLGIFSLTCFGPLTGLPAIIVGALARRDIDRSHGQLEGAGLAAAGIVTGLFGTGISLVLAAVMVSVALRADDAPEPRTETPMAPVPVTAGTRSYGSLDVIDLDEAQTLRKQLAEIARAASSRGRTVVLQTYVRTSKECAEVSAALPDARMQRALENVTLVRVDVEAFEDDLEAMRIPTNAVPWFYKLDATARPTDAVSADEWEENIAENMAPVLGAFVRGTLRTRRQPPPIGTAL